MQIYSFVFEQDEEKELKLRREITPKTDKFFVNDQLKTKEQVVNILQGAGLAKTNPYYIINQGKVSVESF